MMKQLLKGIGMWLLLFLLYFLSSSLANSLAAAEQLSEFGVPMTMFYLQTAMGMGLLCYLVYFFRKMVKEFDWELRGISTTVSKIWWPLLIYVAVMAFQILVPTSSDSVNQRAILSFVGNYPLVAFFPIVIFAPILEELLFRGLLARYLFPKIKTSAGLGLYLSISGVLFSLAHTPTQFIHFMVYFAIGLSLAWLYFSKRDIRYPIALHMFNNSLSFALMLLL